MKNQELFPKSYLSIASVEQTPPNAVKLIFSFSDDVEQGNYSFKKNGTVVSYATDSQNPRILVSLGEKKKSNPDVFRKAGASFSRWCISHRVNQVILSPDQPSLSTENTFLRALLEGLSIGGFEFTRYITKKNNERTETIIEIPSSRENPDLAREISRARIIGESVDLARDWIREPANKINPEVLEERINTVSSEFGLLCKTIEYDQLVSMGAGGITAVGRGSSVKPRLILVEYKGAGPDSPVALVGKAITFDTGGYSLKGSDYIQGMKYDKAGGITVFATVLAASRLKLPVNLIAVIPAAENMISGDAYRPDDILTLLNGLTVEIVSTDAEGRLILFDALAYAQNAYHPRAILDIATLTGGVKVALGSLRAGLLSNSNALADVVFTAGENTGEKVWQLPLDDEYLDIIKSEDADMKNSGPREAQTIVGAIFLKQAIQDNVQWAHIDIAAAGESETEKPWCGKGPTAFGVRLLLEVVENSIK